MPISTQITLRVFNSSEASSLTRLEYLTIDSHYFRQAIWSCSPVRSLTDLIKTAPILKHLKFAFGFRLNMKVHLPEPLEHICSTLVRLLTECRASMPHFLKWYSLR